MAINVNHIVTERILEQLENGVIPWRKMWRGSRPMNYVTRKPYQGINLVLLPYGGEYLTFKQAKELGGHVKKGEKSHIVTSKNYIGSDKNNEKRFTFIVFIA